MMIKKIATFLLGLTIATNLMAQQKNSAVAELGNTKLEFILDQNGVPQYEAWYKGKGIIKRGRQILAYFA